MVNRGKRVSASTASELIHNMYHGPEPTLDKDLGTQLNWYSACAKDEEVVEWLVEYFTVIDRPEDAEKVKHIDNDWIPRTAGFLARLALRGYDLTEHNLAHMEETFQRAVQLGYHKDEAAKIAVKEKPSVQEHIREKASDVIGELEGMIDDGVIDENWDLVNWFQSNQISAVVAKRVADHFQPIADEFMEVFSSDDEQLQEGYSKIAPDVLERQAIIYTILANTAAGYASSGKAIRKPRKKKPVPIEKLLKNFHYAKQYEKLTSIDPAKIVSGQELWTFNFKNKLLSVYRAVDSDGLKIRRSLITNIDEKTSMAKKIGRKTDERIETVLNGGKVQLRKLMDSINGGTLPVKRVGKDTILLRVI